MVTTRPIQLQQAETQEVEQPEIASPERLTFKDRMAMFAEQNTKTTKTTVAFEKWKFRSKITTSTFYQSFQKKINTRN